MRIRLLSDLHLELNPLLKIKFNKPADVVILAGDIGNPFKEEYASLLRQLSLTHNKVFIVSGNHEYYNKLYKMEEIDNQIKNVCKEEDENIHFLQMDSIIYNNVKFMGCTLWSNPTDKSLSKYMNDFKFVSWDQYTSTHQLHKEWLEQELHDKQYKNCVITHHLPRYDLTDDEFKQHPLNSFFVTDINTNGADVWCYGHTHRPNYKKDNNIEYHCNPHGYTGENQVTNFDYIFKM